MKPKVYILHIWRGVEANIVPVKGTIIRTLKKLSPSEDDSVHLLTINTKGEPAVTDFSGGYMEEIREG